MISLNARVSAVSLSLGSIATLALSFAPELVPLRFIALGLSVLGVWGLADEMGIRKPLNRAGLVAIAFAAVAKTLVLLDQGRSADYGSSVLYAFALLLSLLLWSIAFLHRDGQLKVAGAVGAFATAISILALIAGHIFVGAGAYWGIGALYSGLDDLTTDTPQVITTIEVVFVVWSLIASAALWTGQITMSSAR